MHVLRRDVYVTQHGVGRAALTCQHVEDRGELGGLIDPVCNADGQRVRSAAGARWPLRSYGWLQLDRPFCWHRKGGTAAIEPEPASTKGVDCCLPGRQNITGSSD